jgi:insulysin
VNPPALAGALPRLAAFFHSPLFLPGLVAREMHAVDSENKRNLMDDNRRVHQLLKGMSAPGHPWRKFGTGNISSLTEAARWTIEGNGEGIAETAVGTEGDGGAIGGEVRKRLIEWWKKEYCAGRMTLAVIGKGTCLH